MKYAPILITTLNRSSHFKRCIESLSKNKHANKTPLFIALDAPLKSEHYEGYNDILKYINDISGFENVTVFKREHNFGAVNNRVVARKEIFKNYDRVIITEDDNYFNSNFLEYVNLGLDKYESRQDVFAVCGYNYPTKMPENYEENYFLWKGFSGWGFGVWRDKFDSQIFSSSNIIEQLKNPLNALKIEKYGSHYLPALLNIAKTKYVTGDTAICMHLILNDMYCVFPTISKVRNYGHDGSGIHCGISDIYRNQIIDENLSFEYSNGFVDCENEEMNKVLKKHFDTGYNAKIKTTVKYFLFLIELLLRKK